MIGAETYPPHVNGAAYLAQRLAAGLAARGHQVHVLCPAQAGTDRHRPTAGRSTVDGVEIHRVASRRIPAYPSLRVARP